MKKLFAGKPLALLLVFALLISTLPAMAATDEKDANGIILLEDLRLSDLPAHYTPVVDVTAYTESDANAITAAGLDVMRDFFDEYSNIWFFRIAVHEQDRGFFEANDIEYVVVQESLGVDFDWWDDQFSPLPDNNALFRAFSASIPGHPGTPNSSGRPDLVADPDAVFDPDGITFDPKYGFPDRTGFHTVTEYYAEMNYLANEYSDLVKLHVLGHTYNGLPMVVMEISSDPGVDDGRPNSVHTGGHHAREWAGGEYAMMFAWYLITQYGTDERITDILDTTRVWVIPMVNPDGLHFDQRNTPGSWRKNRRDNSDYNNGNPTTNAGWGVDLNRNYPYDFVLGQTDITTETFRGPAPGSEPEVAAVMQVYLNNQVMTDVTQHLYGQFGIWQSGDCPNTADINDFGLEWYRLLWADEQPTGNNAGGQTVGWLFNTANTMSMLSESSHFNFVRTYMSEPALSDYNAITPFTDYYGDPKRFPLAYSSVPGATYGPPTKEITAPMEFLDHVRYNFSDSNPEGFPLTFRANLGAPCTNQQATVANVNSLGETGKLEGKILVSVQAANVNTNRDVALAAQNHGAVAVIFVGGNATGSGWASTDFYEAGLSKSGNPVNFIFNPIGTAAGVNDVKIPVGVTYRAVARELHLWVRGGGENTLTLTHTKASDPANAHLTYIPGSIPELFNLYCPAYLYTLDCAHTYSPFVRGTIAGEEGELLPGAALELSIDVKNRIREGSSILPEDRWFTQTRHSRMVSADGTFDWSVTPSKQRDIAGDGYTITATAPEYSGRYSATADGVEIEFYREIIELDFVLPTAVTTDFDFGRPYGAKSDLAIDFTTYAKSTDGLSSSIGDITGIKAYAGGEPVALTAHGVGKYTAAFNPGALGVDGSFDFVVEIDGELIKVGALSVVENLFELSAPFETDVNSDAVYTLSLTSAADVLTVELEFMVDGSLLSGKGVETLSGFTAMNDIMWNYSGNNMWKGTVTLAYPAGSSEGFNAGNTADIAKFVFAPTAIGDATMKITGIKVSGLLDETTQYLDLLLFKGEATTHIDQLVFSKYDLNRDNAVDALDLGIMLLYCGFDSDSADWGTLVKVNDSKGKPVTASMCDVNGDGVIDMLDLLDLFIHYTK
ncbi:MAG: dockerin type I domain-containing protein [Clostridiales bacterium]|nr:dockerin type I domain-containing protein [Clostridiales bacterium]